MRLKRKICLNLTPFPKKEEAIVKVEEALQYAEKEDKTRFEKTLLKMKALEKTWQ